MSVTAPGFSTTTQQNLQVTVGQHLQVNVQLKTGAATETVQVTTAPPQLQTEEASVGQMVTEQTVNNLPLNGRNFTFLAQLGAGVNTPQADTRGNAASGAFSANGLRPAQNNYLLDGIDNNSNAVDFLNGTNFIVLPPLDAIQEFKVQTADFSAELGRSAGAVLNATIKSGTNSIHGAVWEFFRNDKLDAADWFEDNAGIKKGELRQNQFGGCHRRPDHQEQDLLSSATMRVCGACRAIPKSEFPCRQWRSATAVSPISPTSSPGRAQARRTDALGRSDTARHSPRSGDNPCGRSGRSRSCLRLANTGDSTVYVRDPFGTCGASTSHLHARRLRT